MKPFMTTTLFAATLGSMANAENSPDLLSKGASRFAALDGFRVHYKSFGEGNRAVVFIHGAFADLSTWQLQVPAFAGKARVILIDLPGHGGSDKPKTNYTIDLFARAVDAVLKDAGVQKAVLVGHSMGTAVAYQFWRRYPEKLAALVAVEGMIAPLPFAAPEAVKAQDWRKVKDALLGLADSFPNVPADALRSMKMAVAGTPDHVIESTWNALADPAIWKDDVIAVPVAMILGAGPFTIWPADYEQQVRKRAPNLEFHKIQRAGHLLMLEQPAEFNALLTAFLAKPGMMRP